MITIVLVSIVATRLPTAERGLKVQVLFKSTFDGDIVDLINAELPLLLVIFTSQV